MSSKICRPHALLLRMRIVGLCKVDLLQVKPCGLSHKWKLWYFWEAEQYCIHCNLGSTSGCNVGDFMSTCGVMVICKDDYRFLFTARSRVLLYLIGVVLICANVSMYTSPKFTVAIYFPRFSCRITGLNCSWHNWRWYVATWLDTGNSRMYG